MTDTVTEFVATDDQAEPLLETAAVEQKLIDQLVEQARSEGLQLTKAVLGHTLARALITPWGGEA
nr:hypothetical protein OH837_30560 [Streptomyces canus]